MAFSMMRSNQDFVITGRVWIYLFRPILSLSKPSMRTLNWGISQLPSRPCAHGSTNDGSCQSADIQSLDYHFAPAIRVYPTKCVYEFGPYTPGIRRTILRHRRHRNEVADHPSPAPSLADPNSPYLTPKVPHGQARRQGHYLFP